MAIQFGPAFFSTIPGDASDVTVTTRGGSPVTLATPVSVDGEGRVSFAVDQPGTYSVWVRDSAGYGVTYRVTLSGSGGGNAPGNGTIYDYIDRTTVSTVAGLRGDVSATELVEAISDELPKSSGIAPVSTPSSKLATMADFNTGSLNVGIAGDSTLNDGNDMPRKFFMLYGAATASNIGISERQWNTGSDTYNAPVVIKSGESTTSTGGTVLSDNFNRTAADLVGSTTSGGQTWAGTAASWSADGTVAKTTSTNGAITFNTSSKDHTTTGNLVLTTTGDASSPQFRIYVGSTSATPTTSGNYVWLQIQINSGGTVTVSTWKRISGTNTQLGTSDTSSGIAANSGTPQNVTVTLNLAIQAVSASISVNGGAAKNYNVTVTESDYGALGTYGGFAMLNNANSRFTLDSATIATPFTPGTSSGLSVYNGAAGGTTLAYQQARLATMYPDPLDILLVGAGHNYGTKSPSVFISEVDAFITAFKVAQPDTKIIITSQNPQKSPSTTITAHALRQAALRDYAAENGFEYLPAFELFASQSDGGESLIMSDGIHPTYPAFGSLDDSGVVRWAQLWIDQVNGNRRI